MEPYNSLVFYFTDGSKKQSSQNCKANDDTENNPKLTFYFLAERDEQNSQERDRTDDGGKEKTDTTKTQVT